MAEGTQEHACGGKKHCGDYPEIHERILFLPIMSKNNPKVKVKPKGDQVKVGRNPESYLSLTPVWRFSDFDWEGPWGLKSCLHRIGNIQDHLQQHLSSFETMTWDEILKSTGGKKEGNGNNNHHIDRDKFKKEAIDRLEIKGIKADTLFSLRLDAGTRIYGVRENNCLRITFFDPHHKDKEKCAYLFNK